MDDVRKIIAEEVSRVFENDGDNIDDLKKQLGFAYHLMETMEAKAHKAEQIVYAISGLIESNSNSMDPNELISLIYKQTRKIYSD